jgi:drug/metabolite transporter (DMT)-like permease
MMSPDSSSPQHHRFGVGELLIIFGINILFALNLIAVKVVVDASAPFTAAAMRMSIVALVCLPTLRLVKGRTLALAAYGVLNGGLFLLILNLAMANATNISALAVAGQLGVPFTLLLGVIVYGEKLSPVRIIGVILALAGVVVLGFDPAIATELKAVGIIVISAFCWAVGALIQRKLSGVSVMNTQAWNGLMAMPVLVPFAFWFEPDAIARIPQMPALPLAWLAFSCVGSTIIGQGGLAWLLQRHPLSTVMPFMLSAPVMSAILASLYFHTPFTIGLIVGGLIALAGVTILTFSAPKSVPPPMD